MVLTEVAVANRTLHQKRKLSLIFAIYLVLFQNLGPAFHRADIFGLHDSKSAATCDCGFEHSAPDGHSDESHNNATVEKPLCDCSLCHFFKYSQVDTDNTTIVFYTQQSFRNSGPFPIHVTPKAISQKARGPPTA